MQFLPRLVRRLATKALPVVVIAALSLTLVGVYLFVNDRAALDAEPAMRAKVAGLEAHLAEVDRRIEQLEVNIPPQKERVVRTENVVNQLKRLTDTWSWFGGNRTQQRLNQERLKKMEALQTAEAAKLVELQQERRRLKWERDGYEIERDALAARLRTEEAKKSAVTYYLRRAWLWSRAWICVAAAAYLLGPVVLPVARERWQRRRARTE